MFQYISPIDKARRYLSNQSMRPEDEDFISQATQNGFDESFYLPAIASKKMRQQDTELEKKYQSYKASPTTFMSQFKNEYGKEDRGIVGDTLGFIGNLFTDTAESVEDIGRAVLNPIDTVKGVAGLFSKSGMKAVKGALAENFGSIEKAKETFYENPFDVLSVALPIAKIGTAGKLGKMAKATNLGKAVESSKYAGTINKLADLTNWDINLMKGAAKTAGGAIGGTKNLATQAMSMMTFGSKGQDTLGSILKRTATGEGRTGLNAVQGLTEPQMVTKFEEGVDVAKQAAKKQLDEGIQQAGDATKVPEGFVDETGKLVSPTKDNLYTRGGNLETKFTVGNIKDVSKGKLIRIAEEGIEQSNEAIKAEEVINGAMKKFGIDKNWYDTFDPKKVQNVLDNLQEVVTGKLEMGRLAPKTQDLVNQFKKWLTDAQTEAYPTIKAARESYKEFADFSESISKEIGTGATRETTILNRIKNISNTESMKSAIEYLSKNANVNLEDMAAVLAAKAPLSNMGKSMLGFGGAGAVGAIAGGAASFPILLAPIAGAALTSPALVYKIAKLTGPVRQGLGWVKELAKKVKVPESTIVDAINNVRKMKDSKSLFNLLKELGKGYISPKAQTWLEKINRNVQEQYMNESNELKGDISEMEQEVQKGVESKVQSMPTDYESQFTEPLPEGAYINPDYL